MDSYQFGQKCIELSGIICLHFLSQLFGYSTGFIQGSLSKIQGFLRAILQFSRTKSLGKKNTDPSVKILLQK